MFGAIVTGTDDTLAIQAAVDHHPTVFAASALSPLVEMLSRNHMVITPLLCPYNSPCITTRATDD